MDGGMSLSMWRYLSHACMHIYTYMHIDAKNTCQEIANDQLHRYHV